MKVVTIYLPALLFVALMVAIIVWPEPFTWGKQYIEGMGRYSYFVFVLVLATGVVLAPVVTVPIIPLGTTFFGPFITGILSVIAWTLGATVAFLIARYVGRPVLERWINMRKIDEFIEQFPPHLHFWFIVLLRHTIPVDILSYALGLSKSLRFTTYFFATVIGVTYFSFAFAYLGEAFFTGNLFLLLEVGLLSLAIFSAGWYLLHPY